MQSSRDGVCLTRRQFVAAGAMGGAAAAVGCTARNKGGWDFLDDAQARTLTVICDQIVPADDYPSASQAGVLVYIDRQLARHYRRFRDAYREGLERANAIARNRYGRDLAELAATRQAELVTDISRQNPGFFNLVRNHTFEGYYGAPRHGGNRDAVSWRMLGLAEPPVRGHPLRQVQRLSPAWHSEGEGARGGQGEVANHSRHEWLESARTGTRD